MATSTLGHYARIDETLVDDRDFCDAGIMNRAIGNINHVADQYAQWRIKWVAYGGDFVKVDGNQVVVAGDFYRIWASAPFDLHVRAPVRESYRCRVRMRVSSAHASASATFRAVLAAQGITLAESFSAGPNVGEVVVATTGTAWAAPAALIYLDEERVERARAPIATIDSVGGEEIDGQWLRAQLVVWASVESVSAEARLSGVELREYLPP